MTTRWVLVADSAYAQLFTPSKKGLAPVKDFKHPESRAQSRDLMGNRPHQNQHHMEKGLKGDDSQALRDDESRRFAKELATFLATSHAQNQFRDLVLVADPRFLGMLRAELTSPVAKCVSSTIDRRAVGLPPAEVAALVAAH